MVPQDQAAKSEERMRVSEQREREQHVALEDLREKVKAAESHMSALADGARESSKNEAAMQERLKEVERERENLQLRQSQTEKMKDELEIKLADCEAKVLNARNELEEREKSAQNHRKELNAVRGELRQAETEHVKQLQVASQHRIIACLVK